MFKGEKTGEEKEGQRRLIARTGSAPQGRDTAVFTADFAF